MDLGATICTRSRPHCDKCPLAADCVARRDGRTADLPPARPRKTMPEREVTMLLLVYEGRVLLEPRPPTGVWGGLLSLPEVPIDTDAQTKAARCGCRIVSQRPLAALTHTFTHFRLRMQPVLCTVEIAPGAASSNARWLAENEMASAPLPAPIRRLLTALFDEPPV
jgi:A/G-specific adenine glycosylase